MKRTLLLALTGLSLLTFGCGQPPADQPSSTPTAARTDSSPTSATPEASPSEAAPDASPGDQNAAPVPPKEGETGKEKGPGGMTYTIVKPGDDKKVVAKGDNITAHYTGWLTNGKKFDSSLDRGEPFGPLQIGAGQVIPGWDEGIPGMKVGETRRLYIPAKMAYGERGAGADIPPNSDLVFEVTVLDAKK